MSATDWDRCPVCYALHRELIEAKHAEIKQAYGKVTETNYLALLAELERLEGHQLDKELREDYSQGIDVETGEYSVYYKAHCQYCGYRFEFEATSNNLEQELARIKKQRSESGY